MTETAIHRTDTSDMLIPHGMFRSVLAGAGPIIASVDDGDAEHGAIVHSYLDNVLRFLEAHHDAEDAIIWPALADRCPSAAELLARMEAQHGATHDLGARAAGLLDAWSASLDAETGQSLAGAVESLRAEIDAHFLQEEAEILPLASAYMSPEEWGSLPGHAMGHFTGDKRWLILGLIFEQMTPERLAHTMTLLPPPSVEMWRTTGNAAFDDFVRRVRRNV